VRRSNQLCQLHLRYPLRRRRQWLLPDPLLPLRRLSLRCRLHQRRLSRQRDRSAVSANPTRLLPSGR